MDDLFFAGAGVSLAKGEGLKNPWLTPWLAQFGTDKFYVQTTFHAYLMGWWLKIFGISAKAILGFQCLANLASSCLLISLLKKAGFTAAMSAGFLLCFILFVLSCGLRPEVFGILCILGAIRLWLEKETWIWFLGCFLGACAPLFTPFHFSVIVPLGFAWLYLTNPNGIKSRLIFRKILLAFSGSLLAFVFLLISVNLQIVDYIQTLRLVAASVIPQETEKMRVLWVSLSLGYEPIFKGPSYIFPYFAFAIWLFQKKSRGYPCHISLSLTVLLGFTILGSLSYTQQIAKYLPNFSLLAGGLMVARWPQSVTKRFMTSAWFFVLFLALAPSLLYEGYKAFQIKKPSAETKKRIIEELDKEKKSVFLDEHAIRFFYDFRPPENALDWLLCRKPGSLISLLKDKPNYASWLVDTKKLALYVPDSGVRLKPLLLFRKKYYSFSSNQSEIHLFR